MFSRTTKIISIFCFIASLPQIQMAMDNNSQQQSSINQSYSSRHQIINPNPDENSLICPRGPAMIASGVLLFGYGIGNQFYEIYKEYYYGDENSKTPATNLTSAALGLVMVRHGLNLWARDRRTHARNANRMEQ